MKTNEQLQEENEKLIQALKFVWEHDKTSYSYSGKSKLNRFKTDPKEGRFKTPLEIAEDTLRSIGLRPHRLVDGVREWK